MVTGNITLGKSGAESNGSEGAVYTHQISRTGASQSDAV